MTAAAVFVPFPALRARATAVVTKVETTLAALKRRESALVAWLWISGLAAAFWVLVDVAIGITYNTSLLANKRDELTLFDQFQRGLAAFAMVGSVMGVLMGVRITFNRSLPAGKRLLGFLLSLTLGAGVLMLAGAVAYPHLASALTKFWYGATGLRISFDPASAVLEPTALIPFMLRLASSSLFLGVSILAALAEVAWLIAYDKLGPLREQIAHFETVVRRHDSYEQSRLAYMQKQQDLEIALDPLYQHAKGMTAVIEMIRSYCNAVERARPELSDPASQDKAPFEQDNLDRAKADRFLQSAEALSADPEKLTALVSQYFPIPCAGATTAAGGQPATDAAPHPELPHSPRNEK